MTGELPDEPGVYALILRAKRRVNTQVGRFGRVELGPGVYVYVGSAKGPGGLKARISRHLRSWKRLRWHIDYLLTAGLEVVAVAYLPSKSVTECDLVSALLEEGFTAPVRRLGATDCRRGCPAHFLASNAGIEETVERIRKALVKLASRREG